MWPSFSRDSLISIGSFLDFYPVAGLKIDQGEFLFIECGMICSCHISAAWNTAPEHSLPRPQLSSKCCSIIKLAHSIFFMVKCMSYWPKTLLLPIIYGIIQKCFLYGTITLVEMTLCSWRYAACNIVSPQNLSFIPASATIRRALSNCSRFIRFAARLGGGTYAEDVVSFTTSLSKSLWRARISRAFSAWNIFTFCCECLSIDEILLAQCYFTYDLSFSGWILTCLWRLVVIFTKYIFPPHVGVFRDLCLSACLDTLANCSILFPSMGPCWPHMHARHALIPLQVLGGFHAISCPLNPLFKFTSVWVRHSSVPQCNRLNIFFWYNVTFLFLGVNHLFAFRRN